MRASLTRGHGPEFASKAIDDLDARAKQVVESDNHAASLACCSLLCESMMASCAHVSTAVWFVSRQAPHETVGFKRRVVEVDRPKPDVAQGPQ